MRKFKFLPLAAGLSFLALASPACFRVHIVEDCRDVEARFRRAYREVERLQAFNPERRGRAHEICVLAFDRDSGEFVRVEAPLWLVDICLSLGIAAAEEEREFDFEERYGIDWRVVRNLGRFGPGLLIEVDDEESKVLVWMR